MPVARSQEEGREAIRVLVETFKANLEHYRSRDFDETSTRTGFIDRFFEALGWDVTSTAPDREVVFHARHSMTPEVAGDSTWDRDLTPEQLDARADRTDIPDYSFSIAAVLKFCVEAKRPHTGVSGWDSLFQVKSYAWNRYLPFSVITDFDRLRVYQTSIKPERDRPSVGLMPGYDLRHTDYVAQWDAIWALLSRDAVAAGEAQRLAAAAAPRGSVTVDEAFLRDLEIWRQDLGQDLLRRHPDLEPQQLDEATQRILDRLVFVRVVEDRNVEPNVVLRRYARMSDSYRHLCGEFRRLDVTYNGQLFADHHSERLEVSDGLITRIIAGLYAVDGSPYRFDVFTADFLGKVYERFLGKEFEITGGNAKLVDKPEVRHAGGVYYTPRWVVDHMVAEALDPLLSGKTPAQLARLRCLDMAAGSGSFLLGLFDKLILWHEQYYTANPTTDPARHYLAADGRRRLTSDFKGQIALNNIYGVDLDPQAVEVAQMSLYLRILEEETAATLLSQPRLIQGARLPSLARNVKSGNSLVETDDLTAKMAADFRVRRELNPFDWKDPVRGFKSVLDEGGFDVVIGNPPYTRVQVLRRYHPEQTRLLEERYTSAQASFDLATVFTERVLQLLRQATRSRPGGALSFITTRTFVETDAAAPIRRLLTRGRNLKSIVDFGAGRVFAEASAYTLILNATAKRQPTWQLTRVTAEPTGEALAAALRDPVTTAQMPAMPEGDTSWDLSLPAEDALLRRLTANNPTLSTVSGNSIFQGVVTGADGVFRATDVGPHPADPNLRLVRPLIATDNDPPLEAETTLLQPVYAGKSDFKPFRVAPSSQWLILPYAAPQPGERMTLIPFQQIEQQAPNIARWLRSNEAKLDERTGTWTSANWHSYSGRKNLELFPQPKVMVPAMLDRLCSTYDEGGHFFVNVSTGGYGIGNDPAAGADPEYVSALLNSALLTWVLKRLSRAWRGGWFEARKGNLARLPIDVPEPARQQEIVDMYHQVQSAVAAEARNPDDVHAKRLAAVARSSFDHEVATLYGLSFAERDLIA